MTTFQPMPELTEDQYAALHDDIAVNGVIVPVVVDQHGRMLDGHNRQRIANELGIDLPTEVRTVADDLAAMESAVTLNCARRHLSREQVREVIRGELERRPNDSDRAIARRVGCDHKTVGTVRHGNVTGELPHVSREEAEARCEELRTTLERIRVALFALVINAMGYGITVPEVVTALVQARMRFEAQHDGPPEAIALFRTAVFDYITTVTMWPETFESLTEEQKSDPAPMTPEARAELLDGIANVFAEPVADSLRTRGA